MEHYFDHEKLDCYRLAVEVNRWVAKARFGGRLHMRDQALRASDSVVLNISEAMGRGRTTRAGRNHFRVALGSAAECCAALDCAQPSGTSEVQHKLRRIAAMLHKLAY